MNHRRPLQSQSLRLRLTPRRSRHSKRKFHLLLNRKTTSLSTIRASLTSRRSLQSGKQL
jgi:hypothetical protein